MVIAQGDLWWADLGDPVGSAPGYRRPVVVVQGDNFNRSRIGTIVCVPLTGSTIWAQSRGNVMLTAAVTGLPRDSVAQTPHITALDRSQLIESIGRLDRRLLDRIIAGIDVVLGR